MEPPALLSASARNSCSGAECKALLPLLCDRFLWNSNFRFMDIIETRTICKQPGRYIGWATVAGAPDGTLYAVFSGDRDSHNCPFGKNFIVRSSDGGKTWSEPELVNNTPLDDRDTGLVVCADGTLVMTWFTSYYYTLYRKIRDNYAKQGVAVADWQEYERTLAGVAEAEVLQWTPNSVSPDGERRMGYWTRRSKDGGKSWDSPTVVPASAPHGANVMANGDLIIVGSGNNDGSSAKRTLTVARSSDQGITWKVLATMPATPKGRDIEGDSHRLCEPHVIELPSGKLLMMARMECRGFERRFLWQAESHDGGSTWTDPIESAVRGFPPHLLLLNDGRLLVSYNIRHDPPGQRFCISADEGKTWDVDNEIVLPPASESDLGYPSTAQCADGTLVSVYYQRPQPDQKTALMMTRWRL